MVTLKKRNFIFVLVVTLLVGAAVALALGWAVWYLDERAQETPTDDVTLTAEEYAALAELQKYEKLAEIEAYIKSHYYIEPDPEALMEGVYEGAFLGLGDIYSEYLTPGELEDLMISTTGELEGVGVSVSPAVDGTILVVAPIDDSPAAKAGILPGDRIVKVDGTEYSGDSINSAVSAMRGEAGTKVSLTVLREGKLLNFDLTRALISQKSVSMKTLKDGIAYIRISSFSDTTAADFGNYLRDLELQGARGVVVDLRDNAGGVVDAAVKVADLLLGEGVVTYMENQQGEKRYYKSAAGATNIPFILLVNGNSASSSEIVAAAVKDNVEDALVGTTTYGKGIVQEILPLEEGDAIKLTIMQYFSPKGNSIHEVGVEPDYVVELQEEDFDENGRLTNDRQLDKAIELLGGDRE